MAFIIGGHPRSGTTLLFRLCRDHPQIGITGEFKCFQMLGSRTPKYLTGLARRWYVRGYIGKIGRRAPWRIRLASGLFIVEYSLLVAARVGIGHVSVSDVEATLRRLLKKPVVGDKYPRYVFELDRFCDLPDLNRIMIYRDGRDVVSSFLRKIRTSWKNLGIAKTENTARRVAERWVESMDAVERNREKILLLRYEDFVREPAPCLARMADYLGVDAAGFRTKHIHDQSIGKYQNGLTPAELADVMDVAGDRLSRLGYV